MNVLVLTQMKFGIESFQAHYSVPRIAARIIVSAIRQKVNQCLNTIENHADLKAGKFVYLNGSGYPVCPLLMEPIEKSSAVRLFVENGKFYYVSCVTLVRMMTVKQTSPCTVRSHVGK